MKKSIFPSGFVSANAPKKPAARNKVRREALLAIDAAIQPMLGPVFERLEGRTLFTIAGTLDQTFHPPGSTLPGVLTTDFNNLNDEATAMAVQSDHKVVVVGNSVGDSKVELARYNADGTLDATFGPNHNGLVITSAASGFIQANAVAIDGSGNIFIAGTALTAGNSFDFAVLKYDSLGNQITSGFGTAGLATVDFNHKPDQALGIAIDGSKIVVAGAGTVSTGSRQELAIARLNSNGLVDSTFGGSGKLLTPVSTGIDVASAVAVQTVSSSTFYVVAGYATTTSGSTDFALARYTTSGSLDGTFGTSGVVQTDLSSGGSDHGNALAVGAGGTLYVGGDSSGSFAVAKYSAGGGLMASRSTAIGTGFSQANGLAIQYNGKVVLTGYTTTLSGNRAVEVARYDGTTLTPDASFGAGGFVTTTYTDASNAPVDAQGNAVAIDSLKIIVAGTSSTNASVSDPEDFTVARYQLNNAPSASAAAGALPQLAKNEQNSTGAAVSYLLGQLNFSDVDGDPTALAITAADNSDGNWQYSTDGGTTWLPASAGITASDSSAILLDGVNPNNRIRFVPATGFTGPAPALTVRAWDKHFGADGAIVDVNASSADQIDSFSIGTASISVSVTSASTVYVSKSWSITNDIGDPGLSQGDTVSDGTHSGLIYGINAFSTIQDGVTFVDGATPVVNVGAGAFDEDIVVPSSKPNITITGSGSTGAGATILRGVAGGPAVTLDIQAAGALIQGLDIKNSAGNDNTTAVSISASGTTVQNNKIEGHTVGVNVAAGTTGVTLSGNTITGNANGILIQGATNNLSVSGNQIIENNLTDSFWVLAGRPASAGIRVVGAGQGVPYAGSGNSITGNTITGSGAGVDNNSLASLPILNNTEISGTVAGVFLAGGVNTVTGNVIDNSGVGVLLNGGSATLTSNTFGSAGANTTDLQIGASGAVTSIAGSTFTGVTFINNGSSGGLDGRSAKFGATVASAILGNALTTAQAWIVEDQIIDALDNSSFGFVRLRDGNVDVTPLSGDGAIQRGVDAAASLDNINIKAGSYTDQVVIDKTVQIVGPNSAINPNTGIRSAEAILFPDFSDPDPSTGSSIVYIKANNVSIKGLTIDGDNTALTGGVSQNGANVDATEAIASYEGVSGITVQNNILKNTSYAAIDFDNFSNGNAVTTGNSITNNKLDNIGYAPYSAGVGVLIYNNFYADISNNVMTRVRVGVQTGNFYLADTGTSHNISNNIISATKRGIFYNQVYGSASSFTISTNSIQAINEAGAGRWDGIMLSTIGGSVVANPTDNIITVAAGVTQVTDGYQVWNTNSATKITRGSVTGTSYGVWANNFDGFNAAATGATGLALDHISIVNAAIAGVFIKDNAADTGHHGVNVSITNGTTITGGGAGILVQGAAATVAFAGPTPSAIMSGQSGDYLTLASGAESGQVIDASGVSFGGFIGANGVLPTDLPSYYATEDKITDAIDTTGIGFVRLKIGHVFTAQSSESPNANAVQRAVGIASNNDVINIQAGTFVGQIKITRPVTLLGAGNATILKAPALLSSVFTTTSTVVYQNEPVVTVQGVTADVESLKIDGNHAGSGASNGIERFMGLAYFNASGLADGLTITGIRDGSSDGTEQGFAFYAFDQLGSPQAVTLSNSIILDYQKAGALFFGSGLSGSATANHITGDGAIATLGQIGLQISNSAVISASGNFISGNDYIGTASDLGTNVILDTVGTGTSLSGNTISGGSYGIVSFDAPATPIAITGNTITGNDLAAVSLDAGAYTIDNNTLSGGDGIDLFDNVTGTTITNNQIAASASAIGLYVDSTVTSLGTLSGNQFTGAGFDIYDASAIGIDATANTFGGVDPSLPTTSLAQLYSIEDQIQDGVDSLGSGLVRIRNGNVYVTQESENSQADSIQRGVTLASATDTVHVQAGTFTGQIDIGKALTLIGAGDTTIVQAPASLSTKFTTSDPNKPIIWVHNTGAGNVESLKVDGLSHGNGNYRFIGVAYYDAGGLADSLTITNITTSPLTSDQHGFGFYAYSPDAPSRTLTLSNSTISNYQKVGVALLGNVVATVSNTTVTGIGLTSTIVQNGIEVAFGASAQLVSDTVSGNEFDGPAHNGIDVLIDPTASGVTVSNSTLSGADYGIVAGDQFNPMGGPVAITANTVTGTLQGAIVVDNGSFDIGQNTVDNNATDAIVLFDNQTGTTIHNNYIRNNTAGYGIYVAVDVTGLGPISTNYISGNQTGVRADSIGTPINITGNYWGSINGPASPLNTYAYGTLTTGDSVVGNVSVVPWLIDGIDSAPLVAGFQHAAPDSIPPTVSTPSLAPSSDSFDPNAHPLIGTNADRVTNINTPTLTGNAEPGATVTILDGTTVVAQTTADGAGHYSVTTSVLADGSHTLKALATDQSGNSTLSGILTITVDTIAPAVPSTPDLTTASDSFDPNPTPLIGTNLDNVTNVNAPTFTGSAEAGALIRLFATQGATTTQIGTTFATGGSWSITSSILADGSYTITATATDLAGNVSPVSGGLNITVDTLAPAAPSTPDPTTASDSRDPDPTPLIGTTSDNVTNVNAPTFSGTAEAGALIRLYATHGITTTQIGTAFATGGNWTINSSTLADGSYIITATATDLAGNVSAVSGGLNITVDTVAPAAPSTPDLTAASDSFDPDATPLIGTNSDNVTNVNTPTFTGSAETGSLVRLYSFDGFTSIEVGHAIATGGTWTITSSALADDSYTMTATATDLAGNVSALSGSVGITIDTAPPAAPSAPDLTAASDSFDPNATPLIGTSADNTTNINTPTFTGTAEAGSLIRLYETHGLTTTQIGTAFATGGGSWTITSSTLTDGSYTITATATDLAGNLSAVSGGLSIVIDTAAPAAPSTPDLIATDDSFDPNGTPLIGTNADNVTNVNTPAFTGTAEAGALIRLYATHGVTTVQIGTTFASGGVWSIASTTLADGAYAITATATDLAGNVSALSGALSITVDTLAPAAPSTPDLTTVDDSFDPNPTPLIGSSSDNITKINSPTFAGTAEAGALIRLFATQGATTIQIGTTFATGGSWSITSGTLADGSYTITATATDLAGNVSPVSGGLNITIDTIAPAAPSTPDLIASSDSFDPNATPLIGTNSDNVTNISAPTFTGTAEASSLIRLFATQGATTVQIGTAFTTAGGSWAITSSTLTDGSYTITATATDTAGNVSALSNGLAITVDTAAPGAPTMPDLTAASDTGASSTDNITSISTPIFTGSAEAGTLIRLFATHGVTTTQIGTTIATGGSWTITSTNLADGAYVITATATDIAGNVSAASSGLSIGIDSQSPVPTITDISTAHLEGTTISLNGLANDPAPSFGSPAFNWHVVASTGQTIADGTTQNFSFVPADNGTYTITYTITDAAGNVGSAGDVIIVANVVPTLSLSGVTSINEGSTYTLSLDSSDPGNDTVNSWVITWGDGNTDTIPASARTFNAAAQKWETHTTFTHVYIDGPNNYTISATATDEDGTYSAGNTIGVAVNDVAPIIDLSQSATSSLEGALYTLKLGAVTDPGVNDVISGYSINWGDGNIDSFLSGGNPANTTKTHTYQDGPSVPQIKITLIDNNGIHNSAGTLNITVTNVNPTAVLNNFGDVNEGSAAQVLFTSQADVSPVDAAAVPGFHYAYDFNNDGIFDSGDGSYGGSISSASAVVPNSFLLVPGQHTVRARIIDKDGGFNDYTTTFTVDNVAPIVSVPSTASASVNVPFTSGGTFSDPGNDGPWSGTVDYGDGSPIQPLTINSVNKTFSLNHTYSSANTYTIIVQVTDHPHSPDGIQPPTASLTGTGTISLTVAAGTLQVTNFTPTVSGFDVTFNRAVNTSVLNLYSSTLAGGFGASDIAIIGTNTGPVHGSLTWDSATNTAHFIKTGGVLAADSYSLTLFSRADGWADNSGHALDGDSNNTDGGNYSTNFIISYPSAPRVVSIPDFARGPGQPVNSPATANGLTVSIDNGSGVTSIEFDLVYNPALLTVNTAVPAAGLPAGWSTTNINFIAPGRINFTISGTTPLGAGPRAFMMLTTSVPGTAPYGSAADLQIQNVQVNQNAMPAIGDSAVEKVAYLGDASGNGAYTGLDAALIARVFSTLDSGFDAYPLVDPVIIGDASGDGAISGLDPSFVAQESVGLTRPEIPDLPAGITLVGGGVDPTFSIPTGVIGNRGGIVTVPVNLASASGLLGFTFAADYLGTALQLTGAGSITLGSLLPGWSIVSNANDLSGHAMVTLFNTSASASGAGTVANLNFLVSASTSPGLKAVHLSGPANDVSPNQSPSFSYSDGSVLVTPNFIGTAGNDTWTARLSGGGTIENVWENAPTTGSPTYTWSLADFASNPAANAMSFAGLGGADSLTLDFAGGNPVPNGVTFDGGSGSDTLIYRTANTNSLFNVDGAGVHFGGTSVTTTNDELVVIIGGTGDDTVTQTSTSPISYVFNGGTGNDILNINGGSYTFSGDPEAATASLTLNDNSIVTFAAGASGSGINVRNLAALNLGPSALAVVAAAGAITDRAILVSRAFTIDPTAKLDLNNNDMIIRGSTVDAVSTQIAKALNLTTGGYWDGASGITSTSAANNPAFLSALGAIANNDGTGHQIYGAGALLGLFDGQSPAVDDVLIRYTFWGDADLSGKVDGTDYGKIDNAFNHPAFTGWFNGDFNYDNTVDGSDYSLIDNAFNNQSISPITSVAPLITSSASEIAVASAALAETSSVPAIAATAVTTITTTTPAAVGKPAAEIVLFSPTNIAATTTSTDKKKDQPESLSDRLGGSVL